MRSATTASPWSLGRMYDAARIRGKLGEVLKRVGRYSAALEALEPVAASIGETHALLGTAEEGIVRLRALLEQLERDGARTPVAALYLRLGVLMFTAGRYNESLAVGEQAAELARAVGDQHTLVQAVWNRANILQMLGRLDEAQRATHEVFSLVEVVGDLRCLMGVPRDMAYIHALRGTFGAGLRSLARSLALGEQMEDPASLSLSLAIRSWLAVLGGDWQRARADLKQAWALIRQVECQDRSTSRSSRRACLWPKANEWQPPYRHGRRSA